MKEKLRRIKYFFQSFYWLKILNSPFKIFNVSIYFGEIKRGVPYFLPRKWVKLTLEEARIKANETIEKGKPSYLQDKNYDELIKYYRKTSVAVPKKIGFNFCSLGWKTKWDDIRHEWNPMLSFVLFGKQLHIEIAPKNRDREDIYWEAWLWYNYYTNKKLSKVERLKQVFNQYSATWMHYDGELRISTNHYFDILRDKYIKYLDGERVTKNLK